MAVGSPDGLTFGKMKAAMFAAEHLHRAFADLPVLPFDSRPAQERPDDEEDEHDGGDEQELAHKERISSIGSLREFDLLPVFVHCPAYSNPANGMTSTVPPSGISVLLRGRTMKQFARLIDESMCEPWPPVVVTV